MLLIAFGWIIIPIIAGLFLIISVSTAIPDRARRVRCPKCRANLEELTSGTSGEISFYRCQGCHREYSGVPGKEITKIPMTSLSTILYPAIFNRSEEQAQAIAADLKDQHSAPQRHKLIAEIEKELKDPSLHLKELLPFSGDPSEEEIRSFLKEVLRFIEIE